MPEDPVRRLARRRARQAADPEGWRDYRAKTSRAWKERIRSFIREHKQGPCVDCGGLYPHWVYDFDHVREVKSFDISRWEQAHVPKGDTREQMILDEIAKCDLVCANCHRLRHPPK